MADKPTIEEVAAAKARLTSTLAADDEHFATEGFDYRHPEYRVGVLVADLRTLLASHASLEERVKSERVEAAVRAGLDDWKNTPDTFTRFNDWTGDHVPDRPGELCRYGTDGEEEIVVIDRFRTEEEAQEAREAFEWDDMVERIVRALAAFVNEKERT